jgi:hypothetical protein
MNPYQTQDKDIFNFREFYNHITLLILLHYDTASKVEKNRVKIYFLYFGFPGKSLSREMFQKLILADKSLFSHRRNFLFYSIKGIVVILA